MESIYAFFIFGLFFTEQNEAGYSLLVPLVGNHDKSAVEFLVENSYLQQGDNSVFIKLLGLGYNVTLLAYDQCYIIYIFHSANLWEVFIDGLTMTSIFFSRSLVLGNSLQFLAYHQYDMSLLFVATLLSNVLRHSGLLELGYTGPLVKYN